MKKDNFREITDKDLIVFLVAKGIQIQQIKRDPGRNRSLVYFHNTAELENAVLAYTNKSEEINYGDYIAAERRVKTLLSMQKMN